MANRDSSLRHHPFCSGCSVLDGQTDCADWPECAALCFPNLHPAEMICPWCKPGPCTKNGSSTS